MVVDMAQFLVDDRSLEQNMQVAQLALPGWGRLRLIATISDHGSAT